MRNEIECFPQCPQCDSERIVDRCVFGYDADDRPMEQVYFLCLDCDERFDEEAI